MNASPTINVMTAAAIKAGKGLLRDFGEVDQLQVSRKGPTNFVTKADVRTEKLLQRELSKARPDFGFLMEESGEVTGKDNEYRWIIDPLDGTSNFIHAVPYFCISIALEKKTAKGGEIVAAVTFDPIHNELFTAEKGKGAQVNGRRLAVSSRDNLQDAMLVTGRMSFKDDEDARAQLSMMTRQGVTLRYFGATALDLAYLAAGRIDACWYYNVQPWDIAAGILLIREASGIVSELDGRPVTIHSKRILASNHALSLPMQKLLSQAA